MRGVMRGQPPERNPLTLARFRSSLAMSDRCLHAPSAIEYRAGSRHALSALTDSPEDCDMQSCLRSMLGYSMLFFCAATTAHCATVDDLAWLSGCWSQDGAEPGSVELWSAPAGGTLLGVARTIKDGKTVAFEFTQIRALEDGRLAYIAKPSNQPEATFPLARIGEKEIVFENKSHDFPQRIIYRLVAPGVLHARIEGSRSGKESAIDYPMKKMACP
jgi:hypothetical protein